MKEERVNATSTYYLLDGNYHRPNGPARVWAKYPGGWFLFGNRHRYYGPATEAEQWWFLHGKYIK